MRHISICEDSSSESSQDNTNLSEACQSRPSSTLYHHTSENSGEYCVIQKSQTILENCVVISFSEGENIENSSLSDHNNVRSRLVWIEEDSIQSFDLDTAFDETWREESLSEWMTSYGEDIWATGIEDDTNTSH
jgi:hypothetical protein